MRNALYYGDNLLVMREHIPDESVDLVYLDPPFNSNASYNVLFREKSGEESPAQIRAFTDTWGWTQEAALTFEHDIIGNPAVPTAVKDMISAFRQFIGQNDMMAYLVMMAPRLVELRRVLKPTGSLYLHCDPTASHYLKLLMDAVFGARYFRREIIWQRSLSHGGASNFNSVHDTIYYLSKSGKVVWNPRYQPHDPTYIESHYSLVDENGRAYQLVSAHGSGQGSARRFGDVLLEPPSGRHWAWEQGRIDQLMSEGRLVFTRSGMPRYKRYLDDTPGRPLTDVWTDIPPINSQASERLGYPTQKPEALLERIIAASSNEGDVVLDPFCGCGTAVAAAQKLNRQWIGIDVTHLAVAIMKNRLKTAFELDPVKDYDVVGEPQDAGGATALWDQDPYQFQYWAVSLLEAQPQQEQKRGADGGIDGLIYFLDGPKRTPQKIVIQVKGGNVTVSQVRDLKGVVEREKAAMGLFISLQPPTGPMNSEAVASGFYHSDLWQKEFPKIQLRTISEMLRGRGFELPPRPASYQPAQRVRRPQGQQPPMEGLETA